MKRETPRAALQVSTEEEEEEEEESRDTGSHTALCSK